MIEHIFKRKAYQKMLQWKQESHGETALLIEGARRVGKSTLVRQFAKNEYDWFPVVRQDENMPYRSEVRRLQHTSLAWRILHEVLVTSGQPLPCLHQRPSQRWQHYISANIYGGCAMSRTTHSCLKWQECHLKSFQKNSVFLQTFWKHL